MYIVVSHKRAGTELAYFYASSKQNVSVTHVAAFTAGLKAKIRCGTTRPISGSGKLPLSLKPVFPESLFVLFVSLKAQAATCHHGIACYVQPGISPPSPVVSTASPSSNSPFVMPARDHCWTLLKSYQRAIGADRINDHWRPPNGEVFAEPARMDGRRTPSGRMSRFRPQGMAL